MKEPAPIKAGQGSPFLKASMSHSSQDKVLGKTLRTFKNSGSSNPVLFLAHLAPWRDNLSLAKSQRTLRDLLVSKPNGYGKLIPISFLATLAPCLETFLSQRR
jgi:hypothetical protein